MRIPEQLFREGEKEKIWHPWKITCKTIVKKTTIINSVKLNQNQKNNNKFLRKFKKERKKQTLEEIKQRKKNVCVGFP